MFCFVSGCVYILNDFVDIEADKKHPVKRNRPMASGQLNRHLALFFGAILLKPDVIIHAVAYTKVDQAETDQDQAYLVNAYGTRNLAVAVKM